MTLATAIRVSPIALETINSVGEKLQCTQAEIIDCFVLTMTREEIEAFINKRIEPVRQMRKEEKQKYHDKKRALTKALTKLSEEQLAALLESQKSA